ncbi:hypothetical protein GW17_00020182 [Ensete ventricosum]|nr:hypothetical protein GW17_00020182 [Ensete ventricosum]
MGPASINGFPLELGVRGVGGGTLDAECVEVNPNGRYIRVSSLCLTPFFVKLLIHLLSFILVGRVKNIHFLFYLDSDTALAVAAEMVDQLDLSDYDVVFIADFIDFLIMKFVPGWIPSTDHSSSENISPCKQYDAYDNNELHSECPSNTLKSSADFGRSYDHAELSQLNLGQFAEVVDGISYKKMDEALATAGCNLLWSGVDGADKGSHMSANSLVSGSTKSLSEYTTDVDSKGDRGVGEIAEELPLSGNVNNLEPSIYHVGEHRSSSCPSKASSSLSLTDKDQCELRAELDMIETQYQRCFYELSRMREEAMENARKRWFARKSGG